MSRHGLRALEEGNLFCASTPISPLRPFSYGFFADVAGTSKSNSV